MSFYPEATARSHEWTVQAGETLTVDLRRAGPHERIAWAWRGTNETEVWAEVALADAPGANDWHPDMVAADGMRALSRPAQWLRVAVTGSAATVQLLAPGAVEATVA